MNYTAAMHAVFRLACLSALLLWYSPPLTAATVYRSVDENGVVNFSDTPPTDAPGAETLTIATPPRQPDTLQQDHLEEMRKTTDRIAADRMAREKHRAELRELASRTYPQQAAASQPDTIYAGGYWSGGSPFPGHRFPGHGYHPRPEHPVARPPMRPGIQRPSPGADDYPASLVRRHYDPRVREAFLTPRR